MGEHRELTERGKIFEFAELERARLERSELDRKIFRDAELREVLEQGVVPLGRRLRLLDHVAERIVEGERLFEDPDELIESIGRLSFELQEFHDFLETQIDVLRRGVFLVLDRPLRAIEVLSQAVD